MNNVKFFLYSIMVAYISLVSEFVNADDKQPQTSDNAEILEKGEDEISENQKLYPKFNRELIGVETTHNRSFALTDEGKIWSWGSNWAGQLGDGTRMARNTPVQVLNIETALDVSAAIHHTLALLDDGTVMAWGQNDNAQLGDGTTTDRESPVVVQGLPDIRVTAISAGDKYSLARLEDGTVWGWGNNHWAQKNVPQRVPGLSNIIAIDSGGFHSLALQKDGTVWSWANNTYQYIPWQIPGLEKIVAIAAGDDSYLALRSDGTVWAWGDNFYGQLGDGTFVDHPVSPIHDNVPIQVPEINNAAQIEMGSRNGLVITQDKELIIWGANYNGQYGNGSNWTTTTTPSQYPALKIPVPNLNMVKVVSMVHPHVLALTTNDSTKVWSWGGNRVGELGNSSQPGPASIQTQPKPVVVMPRIESSVISADLHAQKSRPVPE